MNASTEVDLAIPVPAARASLWRAFVNSGVDGAGGGNVSPGIKVNGRAIGDRKRWVREEVGGGEGPGGCGGGAGKSTGASRGVVEGRAGGEAPDEVHGGGADWTTVTAKGVVAFTCGEEDREAEATMASEGGVAPSSPGGEDIVSGATLAAWGVGGVTTGAWAGSRVSGLCRGCGRGVAPRT